MRSFILCVLVAGCGSSEMPDGAMPDLAPPVIQAALTVTPDLVGFATTLDASQSSDPAGRSLSYAWHFTAVPNGSTVADANLSSTSGVTVTFEPDLGGQYSIALTVSAGADSSMIENAFTVPTVPIFFQQDDFSSTTQQSAVGLIRSDGTGRKLVSCVATADAAANDVYNAGFNTYFSTHAFDPPPGGALPARFAFSLTEGSQIELLVADETSDCQANPPPRVDDATNASFYTHPHQLPRFSPDGSRVLFIDNPNSSGGLSRLVSAAVTGLSLRVIRGGVTGPSVDLNTAPPVWIDPTHVAWVENTAASGMTAKPVIYTAPDVADGGNSTPPTVLADCSSMFSIVNEMALLPDGTLIIAAGTAARSKGGSLDLYRVQGPGCTIVATLDTEPPGGDASDFALSPDGKILIVSSTHGSPDGGTLQHDLFTVPVDGSQPLTFFAGSPTIDDVGPRFLGGGRQILWTQGSQIGDGGVAGAGLMIANTDGTHVRALIGESSSEVVLGGTNSGLSCAWAGPLAGGGGFALLFVLVVAIAAATRRSAARRGPGPWSR